MTSVDIAHRYSHASGEALDACHVLMHRFEPTHGVVPGWCDSFVVEKVPGKFKVPMWQPNTVHTGLWRARSGLVFIAKEGGWVARLQGMRGRGISRLPDVEINPVGSTGVWGLDDDHVWAWGRREKTDVLARFRGYELEEDYELPLQRVRAMHGLSTELIAAAGDTLALLRPDGWELHDEWPSLQSVWAQDDGEIWAVGERGTVLRGNLDGCQEVVSEQNARAIAKWSGRIWIATDGELGLCELVDGQLVSRKPNLPSTQLDARGGLLITCPEMVACTFDGEKYQGRALEQVAEAQAKNRPSWDGRQRYDADYE